MFENRNHILEEEDCHMKQIERAEPENVTESKVPGRGGWRSAMKTILTALITYLQVYGIYYYVGMDKAFIALPIAMAVPFVILNSFFIKIFTAKRHKPAEILGLAGLSFAFYVGLFLPNLNSFSMDYLKAALGYLVLMFVTLYCADYALSKVNWGYSRRKSGILRFLLYLAIPAGAYTVFLLACYPGLVSPDSIYILERAAEGGPYDNLSPLLYTLSIRLFYLMGLKLGAMMILQCIMCALAYAYIVYTFDGMGLPVGFCIVGILFLSLYPMNLMTSIAMWKDVPYTIGVSLIITQLVKIAVEEDYFKKWLNIAVLCFALVITLVARHNGILTVVLTFSTGGVIFLVKKNWRHALKFAIVIAGSAVFYFGALYGSIAMLGDNYREPEDNKVTQTAFYALRVQGLISVYHDRWDVLIPSDREYIQKYLDLEEVDKHIEKYPSTWRYVSYTKSYVKAGALLSEPGDFNRGYFVLLRKYPFEVINAYLKTTGIVWAVPSYGYTMHAAYTYNVYDSPALHDMGMESKGFLPKFKDYILLEIYWKNAEYKGNAILWRPAFFMLIILMFLYHAVRRHGYISYLIAAPAIFNSLGYLVVNEAQDARYVYINFAAALIMMAFAMMKKKKGDITPS